MVSYIIALSDCSSGGSRISGKGAGWRVAEGYEGVGMGGATGGCGGGGQRPPTFGTSGVQGGTGGGSMTAAADSLYYK